MSTDKCLSIFKGHLIWKFYLVVVAQTKAQTAFDRISFNGLYLAFAYVIYTVANVKGSRCQSSEFFTSDGYSFLCLF